jgi:hypothetical protein
LCFSLNFVIYIVASVVTYMEIVVYLGEYWWT